MDERSWTGRRTLAVGLAALTLGLVAAAFWMETLNPPVDQPLTEQLGLQVSFAACTALGALLAVRRPSNAVGWVFLGIGLTAGVVAFSLQYAYYGLLTQPGSLPFASVAAWLQTWTWTGLMAGFVLAILLFPDGRPPSRRWWSVVWLLGLSVVLLATVEQLRPAWHIGQTHWNLAVPNPLGWTAPAGVVSMLESLGVLGAIAAMLLGVAAIVIRYRRSRGTERLQLKWVTYGAVVSVGGAIVLEVAPLPAVLDHLSAAQFSVLPVTAAVAILRHRLYDLDRIISRTVTYALTVASLAALFAVGVLGAGGAIRQVTGNTSSDLVVAVSTLAVAAAFGPLRRRMQRMVDRRFFRSRYDANRTIETFGSRLRNQVDVEVVASDLHGAVVNTMHPTTASLWWVPRGGAP